MVVNQRILNLGSLCWLLSLCRRKKRCLLPRADHLTKPHYVNMINWKDDGQHCIYTCMLLYTYSSSVDINLYETSLGNVIQLAFGKLDDVSGTSFLTFQEQVPWRFRNKFLDVSGTSFLTFQEQVSWSVNVSKCHWAWFFLAHTDPHLEHYPHFQLGYIKCV